MAEGETILFVDRNRISVYAGSGIMKLDLPSNIVRDFDIVDKSGFDGAIDSFIKDRNLAPTRTWIVVSDGVCFSRDFEEKDTVKLEDDIKDFLESIPYNQIISKRFRSQTGVRVIATNLEFIEGLIEVFEGDGFSVDIVVPAVMFPGVSIKKMLDSETAKIILQNKNIADQGNLLTKVSIPKSIPETNGKPQKTKLLPVLIGVFVLLIVILVGVLVAGR